MLFYYGRYSHVVRGKRRKSQPHPAAAEETRPHPAEEPTLSPARKAALRRRWADLIHRVYEVDPLLCERCGGQLRVIGFITEPRIIGKIIPGGSNFEVMPGHLIPSKEPQGGRFSIIWKSETDIHELHLLLSRSRYLEPLPRGEIDSLRVSGRAEPARKPSSTPPAFPL